MVIKCPVCDALITLSKETEISEIISCHDCQSRLVVEKLGKKPQVDLAPAIEEDWGQ